MRFNNIQLVKNVVATMLLLLLFVASHANPVPICGENRFFDRVAQICTNCDDICNPLRGTPYLCEEYASECRPREYRNSASSDIVALSNRIYYYYYYIIIISPVVKITEVKNKSYWMILRHPSVDVNASSRSSNSLKYLTLL